MTAFWTDSNCSGNNSRNWQMDLYQTQKLPTAKETITTEKRQLWGKTISARYNSDRDQYPEYIKYPQIKQQGAREHFRAVKAEEIREHHRTECQGSRGQLLARNHPGKQTSSSQSPRDPQRTQVGKANGSHFPLAIQHHMNLLGPEGFENCHLSTLESYVSIHPAGMLLAFSFNEFPFCVSRAVSWWFCFHSCVARLLWDYAHGSLPAC